MENGKGPEKMQNNHAAQVTTNVKGTDATALTIRTSAQGWLAQLAKAYRNRDQVVLIDDANFGIDPSSQTLLDMGLKTGLSPNDSPPVLMAPAMTLFGAPPLILP